MDSCMVRNLIIIRNIWDKMIKEFVMDPFDSLFLNKQKYCRQTTLLELHSFQFSPSMAASMVTWQPTELVCHHQHRICLPLTRLPLPRWPLARWLCRRPGRTAASLACTHSKPIHKLDVPLAPWPVSDFPRWWSFVTKTVKGIIMIEIRSKIPCPYFLTPSPPQVPVPPWGACERERRRRRSMPRNGWRDHWG